MDPNDRALLQETLALAKENNEILRSMRRGMRWASVMRTIYWVIIIGSMVGAYYYFQPYLQPLMNTYNQMLEVSAEFGKIGESKDQILNILNQPVR